MEKHKTGAATLLIHILAIIATNMFVTRTVRGLVPALLRTKVAMSFAMWNLDSAAAIVKPPKSSTITGVHIAAKTCPAASLASSRRCGFWSDRITRRTTTKKGTRSAVTKSGMTCKT